MKLLSLDISNFRGIESLTIDAQGRNVNIYGPNGAGKTTTEDAFLWLLFGKDSADKKDFDLIPHKPGVTDPDVGAGREPTVEATLEYFGKTVKLKKAYQEEWPKKGELRGQYAGSKTHYFVDDLEVKAGEYNSVVGELIDPELFKLLTNPRYFSEVLSWQERRATLVKIVGDLNVEPDPELAKLMNGRNFDNFYALGKQTVKQKQKELAGLPYAIDAIRKLIPQNIPELPDIDALILKKSELEVNRDASGLQEALQIKYEISEARNKYQAEIDAENKKIRMGIVKLEGERGEKTNSLAFTESDIRYAEQEIVSLSGMKSRKLSDWHEANDRKWIGSETCPTCGQPLPAEQIEEARSKFNRQRSEDLERLKSEGLALKEQIEAKQKEIEELRASTETLTAEISTLDTRIENGTAMLKTANFEGTDTYKQLASRLALVDQTPPDDTEIREIQRQIDEANRIKIQIEEKKRQEAKLTELKNQEKTLNAELLKCEKAVYLCEQHVKKSAKALEAAVNGKFKIARFEMFEMQKNGEEGECCKVVYPNGSTNLSTGERLQTGVDIINTLIDFYGVDAPIWIDNAEGVTLPVESKAQLINLIVSDRDTGLRVEVQA